MAASEKQMVRENPYESPTTTGPPAGKRFWWDTDIPSHILASLFLFGIVQHWAVGLLAVYGIAHDVWFPAFAFATYFVHWSSVGGLIGLAPSRKGKRGPLIGAIAGALLSAVLMC